MPWLATVNVALTQVWMITLPSRSNRVCCLNAIDRWSQNTDSEKIIQTEPRHDHSGGEQTGFSSNFEWKVGLEKASQMRLLRLLSPLIKTHKEPTPVSRADPSSEKLPADLEGALFRFDGDRAFMMEMCQDFKIIYPYGWKN